MSQEGNRLAAPRDWPDAPAPRTPHPQAAGPDVRGPGAAGRLLGITMGCAAGIGPEIILRFWADHDCGFPFQPVVIGDPGVLENCARKLQLAVPVQTWRPGRKPAAGALNVLPVSRLDPPPAWGQPTAASGRAMGDAIVEAVRLVQAGELAAMVTCPIGKKMLNAGGYHYPGHTEMLAALCNSREYAMMMAGERLRVTLVTIHRPLAEVAAALGPEAVARLVALTARSLKVDFALEHPRIAVAGFNPHAGEEGMFGREERDIIAPAVAAAVLAAAGEFTVAGPLPPDTVFYQAARGSYDAVVAIYHDQGLIPFKLLHFRDGVNVTIGLPIVRTSVDHGTAYDIAGKGLADPASLKAAFALAARIVTNRERKGAGSDG